MINLKKQTICDGVNFTCINDSRFKTNRISATMFMPLTNGTASINAILPFILSRSCKEYPSFIKLNERLSELYGATIYASVNKIGEAQALTISINGIDDRYSLDDKSVSQELIRLLCSIIFRPNLNSYNKFKEDDIIQEKRQLVELIDSESNDKKVYSKLRCEQLMCANEKFGINRLGTKEQLLNLNCDDIYFAWRNIVKTSQIELIMICSSDFEVSYQTFKDEFSKIKRSFTSNINTEVVRESKKVKEYTDKMDVSQCKLVMGFRAGVATPDNEVAAMRVMTALFGGTPHSKLFLNVREKMGLCYYCSAKYDRFKGIIFVESGVEKSNVNKAKEEILNQLKSIKNGDFNESEIFATKLALSNNFRTLSDHIVGLESYYISQVFDKEILTPEQQAEKINNVTKEDIINVSNKITLDTVYLLENKN